ncbi:MAG: hypothetical protein P8O11_10480 [Lentibacter sp.]|nr:hypothetical protein [Lentibacter sp.]MDG1290125.1 hypothetical protein [Lentibacter sp.]
MMIILDEDQIAELGGNSACFHGVSMGAGASTLNPNDADYGTG